MSKRIPLQFEKIDMTPIDALEVIKLNFKDIDERTDKILEITNSSVIEREIDHLWDSTMDLFYTATREIERLRKKERTCKMEPVWGTSALQCSECCSYVSTWDAECEIGKINYCPNCGAVVTKSEQYL